MKITVDIPHHIVCDIKAFAKNYNKSVSSVITEAVRHYLFKKKLDSGKKLFGLVGVARISKNIHEGIRLLRK